MCVLKQFKYMYLMNFIVACTFKGNILSIWWHKRDKQVYSKINNLKHIKYDKNIMKAIHFIYSFNSIKVQNILLHKSWYFCVMEHIKKEKKRHCNIMAIKSYSFINLILFCIGTVIYEDNCEWLYFIKII